MSVVVNPHLWSLIRVPVSVHACRWSLIRVPVFVDACRWSVTRVVGHARRADDRDGAGGAPDDPARLQRGGGQQRAAAV